MSLYGDLPQSKDGKDSANWGGALKPPPRKAAPMFGAPQSVLRAAAAGRGGGRIGPGPIGGGRGRGVSSLSASLLSSHPEGYDASPLLGAAPSASTSGQASQQQHPQQQAPASAGGQQLSNISGSSLSIFSVNGQGVQDEYDPSRPNEYEEVIRNRDRRKREAAEEVERLARLRDYEIEREARQRELEEQARVVMAATAAAQAQAIAVAARLSAAAPPGASGGGPSAPPGGFGEYGDPSQQRDTVLNVSGEEAYLRRGRMGAGGGGGGGADAGSAEPRGMGLAQKLLEKMGWKEGDGLGRNRDGMTTPLVAQKFDKRSGVIVNAEPSDFKRFKVDPAADKAAAKAAGGPILGNPTRVICMRNMVGRGEVDEHLEDEVGNELTKYGTVSSVLIFEVTEAGYVPEEAVRIFVQFERVESAVKALIDLTGRFFGGRQVRCSFFSESRFERTDLAPAGGEFQTS